MSPETAFAPTTRMVSPPAPCFPPLAPDAVSLRFSRKYPATARRTRTSNSPSPKRERPFGFGAAGWGWGGGDFVAGTVWAITDKTIAKYLAGANLLLPLEGWRLIGRQQHVFLYQTAHPGNGSPL